MIKLNRRSVKKVSNMERARNRIAVLGSGLSGLVAAYHIQKIIDSEQLPFELITLEQRDQVGGSIRTIQTEIGPIDVGASSFDIRQADIRPFLKEVGLDQEIEYSLDWKFDRFNTQDFIEADKVSYRGIPIHLNDLLQERELSFSDKVSVLVNQTFNGIKQKSTINTTTSIFLEDRFCKAVSTLIAYPNYPENIFGSMELCSPFFFDQHLIQLFGDKRRAQQLTKMELEELIDNGDKEFHLINGLHTLVDQLAGYLSDSILTNKKVTALTQMDDGLFLLTVNQKESIRANVVVSTLPLSESHHLVTENKQALLDFPKPNTSSMATILFQFKKGTIRRYPKGIGFVVPKRSAYHMTRATFLNKKWPSLKDTDSDYLLVEIGRRQEDAIVQLLDETLLEIILTELQEILQLEGSYQSAQVFRWKDAVPHLLADERQELEKYSKEHKKRINDLGLFIGGNGLHGYGLSNAILEGQRLADEAIAYMKKNTQIEVGQG